MQINDLLAETGGLQAMSRELGISEADAARGAAALAPAILGGLDKQAQAQPSGFEGLGGLLGQLGGGSLLDSVLSPQPTDVHRGNDLLGHIFGSKDVSRTVAENASSQTGLDPGLLKRMLPIVTMLIAGYMSRRGSGPAAGPSFGNAGLGGLLGGLLDGNRNGNPLDDILRMAANRRP